MGFSTCPVHSDYQAASGARQVNGTLGARHLCNPRYSAFGVLGSGCAGGTAPVFSIAISVTMNTPRL
jgi:hypothetical protein